MTVQHFKHVFLLYSYFLLTFFLRLSDFCQNYVWNLDWICLNLVCVDSTLACICKCICYASLYVAACGSIWYKMHIKQQGTIGRPHSPKVQLLHRPQVPKAPRSKGLHATQALRTQGLRHNYLADLLLALGVPVVASSSQSVSTTMCCIMWCQVHPRPQGYLDSTF